MRITLVSIACIFSFPFMVGIKFTVGTTFIVDMYSFKVSIALGVGVALWWISITSIVDKDCI